MKNKSFEKVIVLLVLIIIIQIPISSSIVLSASMHSANIHGEDELIDFSKGNTDDLTFNTYIIPTQGHEISLDEISIFFPAFSNTIKFSDTFCSYSECTSAQGNYPPNTKKCSCKSSWSTLEKIDVVFQYDENNNGNINAQRPATLYPDYQPPNIISLSGEQENNQISMSYEISDSACPSCANKCSGFQEIIVKDDSGIIYNVELNNDNCNLQDNLLFDYDKEGFNQFVFSITDNLWSSLEDDELHKSVNRINILTDFTPPTIDNELILKKDGQNLSFISNNNINIDLQFKLKDADYFSANFSMVGNNNNFVNSPVNQYCTGEDWKICKFNNINIKGNQSQVKLFVSAKDNFNNEISKSISKSLTLDNTRPMVEYIGTTRSYEGITYLKKNNNTIKMTLTEEGSGFTQNNVFMNLNAIGKGTKVRADECIKTNKWECFWYSINILNIADGSSLSLSRTGPSYDDAGNLLDGLESTFVVYDSKKPEILNFNIVAIGEFGERTYYQSSDILKFVAEVDNLGGSPITKATADVSELFDEPQIIDGDCNYVEGSFYICTWETSPIKAGQYSPKIKIKVEDAAGNIAEEEKQIAVYGISSDTPNNFNVIVHERKLIPRSINRLVASMIPNPPGYKILVPFELTGGSDNIEVLNYFIRDCLVENSTNVYKQLFEDGTNPTLSPLPMIKEVTQSGEENAFELTLRKFSSADINLLEDFDLACEIHIYQRIENFVYENPEIDEIKIRITAKDSALSKEPSEELIQEIRDGRTDFLEKTKYITEAAKVVKWLESACGIATQIISIWNIAAAIENIGLGIKKANSNEIVYKIGCTLYEGLGSLIGNLYYGKKNLDREFSISYCTESGGKIESDLVGSPEIKFQNNVKEAAKEWIGEGEKKGFPGIRNFCGFVSCEYSTELAKTIEKATGGQILQGVNLNIGDSETFIGSIGRFSTQPPRVTPQKSIVMSAATVCIPGILYNLNKYRQIQCEYLKCLKDTAIQGGPIHICKAKKSQSWCMVIFGEFAESVGILRLIKSLANQGANTAAQLIPNLLKAVINSEICSKKGTDEAKGSLEWIIPIACDLPRAVYNTIDSIERFRGISRYGDANAWKVSGDLPDACKEVFSPEFLGEEELPKEEAYPESGGNMDSEPNYDPSDYDYPFDDDNMGDGG